MTIDNSLHEIRRITSTGMDLPDWKMRFGTRRHTYMTQTVVTTHERRNSGPWIVTKVKIEGGVRLKGGGVSDSAVHSDEWPYPLKSAKSVHVVDCPEWLREFAGQWVDGFNAGAEEWDE